MVNDTYSNFSALQQHEREDLDYRIAIRQRGGSLAVMAPHGGGIEKGTSQVASAIAGHEASLYLFEGLKPDGNWVLHITSENFDEPRALALAGQVHRIVAVHGRRDLQSGQRDGATTWVGGMDRGRKQAVVDALQAAGFEATVATRTMKGLEPMNICNRGCSGAGVQLEIPFTLRQKLLTDAGLLAVMQMRSGAGQPEFAASHACHCVSLPLKVFRSTSPGMPGTDPVALYCQKVHGRPP